jgi:transposase
LERLELLDAKVSRAVLRGRDAGNSILLPDTDVKDAEWIADLLQHGLLKASFIPSGPQRELRDLTRYRVRLAEEKAREVNRVQKTLEDTNLKLGDVVSDIMGKASRLILQAIADGETDPGRLAALAVGRVHASQEQLEAALRGHVRFFPHLGSIPIAYPGTISRSQAD